MIQHASVSELLKYDECGRRLNFEWGRLKEDFDQRVEIILLGELAWIKSKWIFAGLGRGHIFEWPR